MAILSISREYQSGGRDIGQMVAEQMGYELVDKERILAELKEAGKRWGDLGEEMDEVRPNLWERFDWQYRGFVALIESVVYDYALKDRLVILGRGSNFLLKDIPHVLKIRVRAPLERRIRRMMEQNLMDRATAEWVIAKTDRNRAGYIQTNYGINWEDPQNYDFIFDTGEQSYEQILSVVLEGLRERERRSTVEGLKKLKGYTLAARVKAQILTHPGVFIPTLDIFFDGQALVLRGVIHSPKEYHRVEKMAQATAEAFPVRNELHYRA
jgi:cytidylate kinase